MKKLHLICNAHLDPIWQWTWDEGIAAAIATYKSAADLADEFDYIFCHNEAMLYEEIEKKAPALFKRIQEHVKNGKWIITGGWYLQPDCLCPAGESIVRQIQTGQKYFREKFGVTPTIATNYDSFGHSLGLVQILKKSGYKGYLSCRPGSWQFTPPSRFFDWVGPDGSRITVSISSSYNSALGYATKKIKEYACGEGTGMLGAEHQAKAELEEVDYVLWGVGNHGGGPSRQDLREIEKLVIEGVEICHSSPEKLFEDGIRIGGEVRESLITSMPGCYSSMARVKKAHRETENLLYATEKMLAVAKMAGYTPDLRDLEVAEKKLLLSQFHDILPGTSIPDGEQDGLEALAMARKIVKDHRTGAFLYLVTGEDVAKEGEYPVFVFNYMPYEVTTPIEVEFMLADQNWSKEFRFEPCVFDGEKEIPSQCVKELSTLNLDWRKRIVFNGELKPLGITKFSVRVKQVPVEAKSLQAKSLDELIQNSGILTAPVRLEMYDDTADPWGMSLAELKELGKNPREFALMSEEAASRFCCGKDGALAPIHTLEDGEVLTSVEGVYTLDNTNAAIEYKFYKDQPFVDLKVTVEYAEKNKMIRLKVPAPKGKALGDGPYIVEEKLSDGRETCFQKWFGTMAEDGQVFAVLNDGVYGGKTGDGYLYLTLLRGAGYCIHPIGDRPLYPTDRYLPRIEGGRYEYKFRIYRGSVAEVCEGAELFNQPPYAVNVFPTGEGKKRALVATDKPVVMPVCKISEGGYVLRFFNPVGESKEFRLQLGEAEKAVALRPYEILSVFYDGEIEIEREKLL